MNNDALFQTACFTRYRFDTQIGQLSTEEVCQLSLTQLNTLAKSLNKQVKELEEEDFINNLQSNHHLANKFEIVKFVIQHKLDLRQKAEDEEAKESRKRKILEILAEKEDSTLTEMSKEDLLKELNSL